MVVFVPGSNAFSGATDHSRAIIAAQAAAAAMARILAAQAAAEQAAADLTIAGAAGAAFGTSTLSLANEPHRSTSLSRAAAASSLGHAMQQHDDSKDSYMDDHRGERKRRTYRDNAHLSYMMRAENELPLQHQPEQVWGTSLPLPADDASLPCNDIDTCVYDGDEDDDDL